MFSRRLSKRLHLLPCLLAVLLLPGTGRALQADESSHSNDPPSTLDEAPSAPAATERSAEPVSLRLEREGVVVELEATPAAGRSMEEGRVHAGDWVDLEFRITDAATGRPLQGQFPGAWVDYIQSWEGDKTTFDSCRDRVGLYLQGLVGVRPLIDLNSYFVLVMNRDPSISVIDPITGISGITKLYAQINLESPAADWDKTLDEKRLFVSMPSSDQLAVVDTDVFKVTDNLAVGAMPMRVALQPDGQYVWVGNDAEEAGDSGVTVIDTDSLEILGFVATGAGHHEIAFSADSRFAFVTNRDGGTVSIVDVQGLKKVADVETGPEPISLAFSSLSQALYVADGQSGEVVVIDGRTQEPLARIQTDTHLGPLGFSQDGRWGVVVAPHDDVVYVIDPATNGIAHTLEIGKKPYQVAFSRSFAYVRSLGTERVAMIDLSELGKEGTVPVVTFAAGQRAPEEAKEVGFADVVVEAPGEAAVLVASPADTTVYYYMEGMNAPMGNFRNYGHLPRAVQVVDRSLQEREPGVYTTTMRIPDSGVYEVAFLLDSPSILHCFEVAARPNPVLPKHGAEVAVEYLTEERRYEVGANAPVRFRLTDRDTGKPRTDLSDVGVVFFATPGGLRRQAPAAHVGEGIYQADVTLLDRGAHYVYAIVPSLDIQPDDLHFMTLVAGGRPRRR